MVGYPEQRAEGYAGWTDRPMEGGRLMPTRPYKEVVRPYKEKWSLEVWYFKRKVECLLKGHNYGCHFGIQEEKPWCSHCGVEEPWI